MENEEVQLEDSNQAEEQSTSETEEVETIEANPELTKAQELARNQKIRAEKAERELKLLKAQGMNKEEVETPKGLSLSDVRALNKVHDEDVERVEKFAKAEGVSIAEAMKNEDLQAILGRRDELRKTAAATVTSGSRRGAQTSTPEQIVEAGLSGKEVDPVKFAEAQMALKIKGKT